MTIYGLQGGWCEHSRSWFDDRAFDEYLNLDDDQRQALVDELLETFKDENGNWDFHRIATDLYMNGVENGFTNTEWNALIQLFSEGLDPRHMIWVYEAALLHSQDPDGVIAAMELLSEELVIRLVDLVFEGDASESELNNLLRRTQLVEFLLSLGVPMGYSMFVQVDVSRLMAENGGIIIFDGVHYYLTGTAALSGDLLRFLHDQLGARFVSELEAGGEDSKSWFGAAFSTFKLVGPFIPGIGKFAKAVSVTYSAASIILSVADIINHSDDTTQAERNYAIRRLTVAMIMLGGSVVTVDTPDGIRIVVMEDTFDSVVNMAALENLGYPTDVAIRILMEPNNQWNSDIFDFLNCTDDPRRAEFEDTLTESFRENRRAINTEFGLDLGRNTPLEQLPPEVLGWVIQNNADSRQPIVWDAAGRGPVE